MIVGGGKPPKGDQRLLDEIEIVSQLETFIQRNASDF